jgi:hypothetical protein
MLHIEWPKTVESCWTRQIGKNPSSAGVRTLDQHWQRCRDGMSLRGGRRRWLYLIAIQHLPFTGAERHIFAFSGANLGKSPATDNFRRP